MGMEIAEAELFVRRAVKELADQRHLMETATRHASALTKIIAGYVEMFPELQQLVDADVNLLLESDDTPKGAEAVRLILQASANEWWLVSELVESLRARGWLPDSENPANAVRAALERLLASPDSDIVKSRRGNSVVYGYRPDDAPPTPAPPYGDEEPF